MAGRDVVAESREQQQRLDVPLLEAEVVLPEELECPIRADVVNLEAKLSDPKRAKGDLFPFVTARQCLEQHTIPRSFQPHEVGLAFNGDSSHLNQAGENLNFGTHIIDIGKRRFRFRETREVDFIVGPPRDREKLNGRFHV